MLLAPLLRDVLLERSLPAAPPASSAALRQRLYRQATSLVPPSAFNLRGAAERPKRSDEELLTAWLHGDASAFEALMDKHLGWMVAWAGQHLPLAEAEDAAQEAFIALFRGATRLQPGRPLKGYLFGLLRVEVLRAQRALHRRRGEPLEEEGPEGQALTDSSPTPEMALLHRRSHEEVAEALQRACSLREQEVLLFTLEGTPDSTIAKALETTEGNVRVLRHRALGKLRQALGVPAEPGRAGEGHGR